MKTIYKSDNGRYFDTKKECVDYEISYYKLKMLSANSSYLHYKRITHKACCQNYEKILKQSFKDTKGMFNSVSNTKARKLYWELRNKYKKDMLRSVEYLKELKGKIKMTKQMMKECIDIKEPV